MPSPPNLTNITPPRVPLIDERTGLISREWYRFFLNLFNLTGGGANVTSLTDLQLGPPAPQQEDIIDIIVDVETAKIQPTQESALEQIAELAKQVEALSVLPLTSWVLSELAELQAQIDGMLATPASIPVVAAALTKVDDTNVTLTLGGSPSTALLAATSLTLGWTGQLATSRGGTGLSSYTANGVVYASSTSALATGSAFTFDGNGVAISVNSSTDGLRVTQTGTGNALLIEDNTNPDGSPLVVDSIGRVIAGYTSSISADDAGGANRTTWAYQANNTTVSGAGYLATYWADNAVGAGGLSIGKSRGASVATRAVVQNGDEIGQIGFVGDDGTNFISAAGIFAAVDGTPGTNDMPGRLVFSTTADGASAPTERLRIAATGALAVNGAANYGTSGQVLTSAGNAPPTWTTPTTGTVTSVAQTFTGGLISVSGSPITGSGTLALTVAGTSGGIPYFSSASTWTSSAALTFNGTNLTTTGSATATAFIPSSSTVPTNGLYLQGTNAVGLATNSIERFRVVSTGQAIFTVADMTAANPSAVIVSATGKAAQTGNMAGLISTINTDATYAGSTVIGVYANIGSIVVAPTNAYGFYVASDWTSATNNYAYYSNVASGANRWNFYANGTANNYFAGNVGIANTSPACALDVTGGIQTSRTGVTAPAATDGNIFSGTYTPTLTNTTNITASTANTTYYTRVGNMVMVSGRVSIDPTAAGSITLGVSLPIASDISNNCWGVCNNQQGDAIAVTSDNTNDRASFIGVVADAANRVYSFTFQYQVA
jgi:hypothetical protein